MSNKFTSRRARRRERGSDGQHQIAAVKRPTLDRLKKSQLHQAFAGAL